MQERDHWVIMKQALFLKPFSRDLDFNFKKLTTLPIRVKIFQIPAPFWIKRGISACASNIGKPLFTDETTTNLLFLKFACVRVELQVG